MSLKSCTLSRQRTLKLILHLILTYLVSFVNHVGVDKKKGKKKKLHAFGSFKKLPWRKEMQQERKCYYHQKQNNSMQYGSSQLYKPHNFGSISEGEDKLTVWIRTVGQPGGIQEQKWLNSTWLIPLRPVIFSTD